MILLSMLADQRQPHRACCIVLYGFSGASASLCGISVALFYGWLLPLEYTRPRIEIKT